MARTINFEFRKGSGAPVEIMFGEVTLTPTLMHSVGTSAVIPAPTKADLVDGKASMPNVAPSPEPVAGQVEWAYKVVVKDRHGKHYEWLVGVPDALPTINFIALPRYSETKPPLFGRGPQGVPGTAATIAIGTTTSGPTPAVTNTGTATDAVLNFTLAKGDKGDKGDGVTFTDLPFSTTPSGFPTGVTVGNASVVLGWPEDFSMVVTTRRFSGRTTQELINVVTNVVKTRTNPATVDTWTTFKTVATNELATPLLNGLMPALDKAKLDGMTPAANSKTFAALASTYQTGFSTLQVRAADGWPIATTGTVVTQKNATGNASVSQWLYPVEGGAPQYRVSDAAGNWQAFESAATESFVRGRESVVDPNDYATLQEAVQAAYDRKLPLLLEERYTTTSVGSIFWSVVVVGGGSLKVGSGDAFTPNPTNTGVSNTIYYNSLTGADTNSGLDSSAPLKTFSAVVRYLNRFRNTTNGNITIRIQAGTHKDTFRSAGNMGVFRTRLKIVGELGVGGERLSVIDGTGTSNAIGIWIEPGTYCAVEDLKITNFTSSDTSGSDAPDTGAGIVHKGGGDISVRNVEVSACSQGVGFINATKGYISGSLITNCSTGVRVLYGSSAQIGSSSAPNTISNCTASGVYVSRNSVAHVDYCTIASNGRGISVDMAARVNALSNSYNGNTLGVRVEGAAEVIVSAGSVFSGNTRDRAYYGAGRETRIQSMAPVTNEWGMLKHTDTTITTGTTSRVNLINYGSAVRLPPRHFTTSDSKVRFVANFNTFGGGTKLFQFAAVDPANTSNLYVLGEASVDTDSVGHGRLEFDIYGSTPTSADTRTMIVSNNRAPRISHMPGRVIGTSHEWVFRLMVTNSDTTGTVAVYQSEIYLQG